MAAVPDIAMVVTIWVGTHRAKGERKAYVPCCGNYTRTFDYMTSHCRRLDRLSSFVMLAWYLRNIQM